MCFHRPVLICCADHCELHPLHPRTFPALQQLCVVLNMNRFAALHDNLLYRNVCQVFLAEAGAPVVREADDWESLNV